MEKEGSMISTEDYYGAEFPKLKASSKFLERLLENCPIQRGLDEETKAIIYVKSRIKSPQSMLRKLKLKGLPLDGSSALRYINDAVGVRAICAFNDDVYRVAAWVSSQKEINIIKIKDYIAYPKANGYRSYHMILMINEGPLRGTKAELQLRTIATDFWASLEHQIKYKRSVKYESLVKEELKRCADEIASVDLSMQTIRELVHEEF